MTGPTGRPDPFLLRNIVASKRYTPPKAKDETQPTGLRGAVNGWECPICRRTLWAIDLADGTTPFLLSCRMTEGCLGMATSLGYPSGPPLASVVESITHQWAIPGPTQLKQWRRDQPEMYDHAMRGGLILDELDDKGRAMIEQRTTENWS